MSLATVGVSRPNMRSPESPAAFLASPWRSSSARQAFVGLLAPSAGPLSGVTLHKSDRRQQEALLQKQSQLSPHLHTHMRAKVEEAECIALRKVLLYLKIGSKLFALSPISQRHCTVLPRVAESSTALTAE